MFGLSTVELIAIAVVVFILFGGKKLPELARGLSKATREFNKGLKGEDEAEKKSEKSPEQDV
jgi:sec-independent protein translocase protein TatA